MRIFVDATTLIALGTIGELDALTSFDGELVVLPSIRDEVTTEPAATNVDRFLERYAATTSCSGVHGYDERAMKILDETDVYGDVRMIAGVLAATASDAPVAVVSDDRRLRTIARGLGAEVTGTIGTVVRAVEDGLGIEEGKTLVRRVDEHGLHMTAELREAADSLVEDAGE